MKNNRRILLYGNSVILGSMGAILRRCSRYEVITISPIKEACELAGIKADIILFDLETAHTQAVFSLLETDPDLLLIGISPDVNLVKVWSGRQLRELSIQDLLKMINGNANDPPVDPGDDEGIPHEYVTKE